MTEQRTVVQASPEHFVDLWVGRHPHTHANEQEAHYGDQVAHSERGTQQIEHLVAKIKELQIDHIVSSTANRTLAAIVGGTLDIPIVASKLYYERRRPSETIGSHGKGISNNDPEVRAILETALENYGPGYQYSDEETYEEAYETVNRGLNFILDLRRKTGHRRFFLLGHGLRNRQYFVKAFMGDFTPDGYRWAYRRTGFPNAGIMHMWFGPEYHRPGHPSWQVDIASNDYLPKHLR